MLRLTPKQKQFRPRKEPKRLTPRELELLATAAINLKLANDEATHAGRGEGWTLRKCVDLSADGLNFGVVEEDRNYACEWAERLHAEAG